MVDDVRVTASTASIAPPNPAAGAEQLVMVVDVRDTGPVEKIAPPEALVPVTEQPEMIDEITVTPVSV